MNLSLKQKTILYISIVFFTLMALYVNSFLKDRNNFEIEAITQEVDIYYKKNESVLKYFL